jgi:hypothetical protein
VKDIAIDWISQRLYWTEVGRIATANLNGSSLKTLISQNVHQPFAIAVDPESALDFHFFNLLNKMSLGSCDRSS